MGAKASRRRRCPVCRRLVSRNGGAWASHMRTHVAAGEADEVVKARRKGGAAREYLAKPERVPLTADEVRAILPSCMFATVPGRSEDGALIHVGYRAFRPATPQQVKEAKVAEEVGQPLDQYTGRLNRVWETKNGDTIITMFVVLQRENRYRSFNVDRGNLFVLRVLER